MTNQTQTENILRAGNTCETLKPKEVVAWACCEGSDPSRIEQGGHAIGCPNAIRQVSSELNTPDIDECAPILPESKNENFELPEQRVKKGVVNSDLSQLRACQGFSVLAPHLEEEPEPLPTIAIWQLRGRVIELERRLDELTDRIALFNVKSSYKL